MPELMMQVFNRTFRRNENAILVCKVSNRNPTSTCRTRSARSISTRNGGPVHLIYNRELPHYQLATLYRSADCYVSTTRGEGWGLPLLEAMACGLPAIATDWEVTPPSSIPRTAIRCAYAAPFGGGALSVLRGILVGRSRPGASRAPAARRLRAPGRSEGARVARRATRTRHAHLGRLRTRHRETVERTRPIRHLPIPSPAS